MNCKKFHLFFLILFVLSNLAFSQTEDIALPELVKELGGKDITNISTYPEYIEKYQDIQMIYGTITGLEMLKNFIEARQSLVLKEKNKQSAQQEISLAFGKDFAVVSADYVLRGTKYKDAESAGKYVVNAISDFISNNEMKTFEEKLFEDKKVNIQEAYDFYSSLMEKISQQIIKEEETYKQYLGKFKTAFDNLKFQAGRFLVILDADGSQSKQFDTGQKAKVTLDYSTLGLDGKEVNLSWKILSNDKILKEGELSIPCEKEATVDMADFEFTQDILPSQFKCIVKLNYKDFERTLKPFYFYLANPELKIIKIYTTDDPGNKKEVNNFIVKRKITFVVLHEILIDLGQDEKKKIEFVVYDSRGNIVQGLSSSREFKAVKGRRISKFADIIPANISPGEYTFEARITTGGITAAMSVNFIIEANPLKIERIYISDSLESQEPVKKIKADKHIYLKIVHLVEKNNSKTKKIIWSIFDSRGKKIFTKVKEYPPSQGEYSLYHVISFTPQSPSGKYVYTAEIVMGQFSDKKSYSFELNPVSD